MTIKATGTTGTDLFVGEPGRQMHRLPDGADGLPGPASSEGNEAQVDFFGGFSSSAAEDRYCVAGLMGAVPGTGEGAYGWCGLCRSFTEFPHDCPGEGGPEEDRDGG
jgi:hypothetical protein